LVINRAGMMDVTAEARLRSEPNFLANPLACWDKRS
jgi:hypothetical protein